MVNPIVLPLLSALSLTSVWIGNQAASAQMRSPAEIEPICTPQQCGATVNGRRSLTVVGQGQVTAPADVATLEFRFGNAASLNDSRPTTPGLSIRATQQLTEEALKPTRDALAKIDVPSRSITVQTSSLQSPKLLVQVEKPTQERLQTIVLAVNDSLQGNQQLFLQSIGATYRINICQPLERQARRLALRDALNQSKTLAQDVQVQLGELLSVTAYPIAGSPSLVGCGTKVGVQNSLLPLASEETAPPYDPADKPEVQVRSQVSITYAIVEPNPRK